jgi:hypothetical protein
MTGVNEVNAVMREQARIREAIVKDCKKLQIPGDNTGDSKIWVRLADVLKVLDGSTLRHESIGYSPWPNRGDTFYRINSQGYIIEAPWTGSPKQASFLAYGNVFRTREQAAAAQEKISAMLKPELIDWVAHDSRNETPRFHIPHAMPHQKNCDTKSNQGIPKAQKDESYCTCGTKDDSDPLKDAGFEQRGAAIVKEGDLD